MSTSLKLETAKRLLEVAENEAEKRDAEVVTTITDAAGNVVAVHRMDGSDLASVNISEEKAYTAAAMEVPTHELVNALREDEWVAGLGEAEHFLGLHSLDDGRITLFAGGYVLERDGEIYGSIGVSGGSTKIDMRIAEAAVEEFESLK